METQSPARWPRGGFALSSAGPLRWLSLGKGSLPARGSSSGERPRETGSGWMKNGDQGSHGGTPNLSHGPRDRPWAPGAENSWFSPGVISAA